MLMRSDAHERIHRPPQNQRQLDLGRPSRRRCAKRPNPQVHASIELIGGPNEIWEMLELVAQKNVKPWVEEIPMEDWGIVDMHDGKARYLYVLVNGQ